ncbi:MAG: hypothetical protein KAY24_09745 [Candidatus Eisenbacteria sp.]|nr:hypothetical protein [Candidatus Eisenbacteria bacterium]
MSAILFNRDRAEQLEVPLVLLAHQSHYEMRGNGRRTIHEHLIWYVGDPGHPFCETVKRPGVVVDNMIEIFLLKRCRIHRGQDTLLVEPDRWELHAPRNWPSEGCQPWSEVSAELPKLKPGDIVELAYSLDNRWTTSRIPSDWVVSPLVVTGAPTLERHIIFSSDTIRNGRVDVIGQSVRPIRHYGGALTKTEFMIADLPAGPADPTSLETPRAYFTSHQNWTSLRRMLQRYFHWSISDGEKLLKELGHSIMETHRASRDRLKAVLEHVERHCKGIPVSLTASTYYPRNVQLSYGKGAADPMERALLVTALAGAAIMKVDVFLARGNVDDFRPDLPTPMQFDRVILRVLLAEEDRYALIDPLRPDLQEIEKETPDLLLMGIEDTWPGFYQIGPDGDLESVKVAP